MIIQKSYLQKNSVFDTLRNPLSITKKIGFSLTILENTKNLLFMEYIDLFDLCQLWEWVRFISTEQDDRKTASFDAVFFNNFLLTVN